MAGRKEPQIPDAILDQLLSGTEASTACLQSKFLPLHRYTSRACGCADLMASPWMPPHTTRPVPEFAATPLQGHRPVAVRDTRYIAFGLANKRGLSGWGLVVEGGGGRLGFLAALTENRRADRSDHQPLPV